jgi:SAM-dependent methyltransferase
MIVSHLSHGAKGRSAVRLPSAQGVWKRLSRLGETLGVDWLTYNPGVFKGFHHAALRNAPLVAEAVLEAFPDARSLVDVGCGTGATAAEFQQRGLRVLGFEYSARGRRWSARTGVRALPFDVSKRDRADLQDMRFDLTLSTEVAEHVPPEFADAFTRFVASTSDRLVVTAGQPGPRGRGNGHVNEQPLAYWIAKFTALGFTYEAEVRESIASRLRRLDAAYYLHENLMVFER